MLTRSFDKDNRAIWTQKKKRDFGANYPAQPVLTYNTLGWRLYKTKNRAHTFGTLSWTAHKCRDTNFLLLLLFRVVVSRGLLIAYRSFTSSEDCIWTHLSAWVGKVYKNTLYIVYIDSFIRKLIFDIYTLRSVVFSEL